MLLLNKSVKDDVVEYYFRVKELSLLHKRKCWPLWKASPIYTYPLLLLSVQLNAGWQRPVTNYTRHTYKAGNQNWMLQQHDNGWMYVANSNGLLEFDGASWNLYPIRNAKARAMRIGNDGRIYIGGIGRFGYFTPNRLGGLDYTCLSDNLPPNSIVGVIWNILQDKERIYFQSDRSLFYWEIISWNTWSIRVRFILRPFYIISSISVRPREFWWWMERSSVWCRVRRCWAGYRDYYPIVARFW